MSWWADSMMDVCLLERRLASSSSASCGSAEDAGAPSGSFSSTMSAHETREVRSCGWLTSTGVACSSSSPIPSSACS